VALLLASVWPTGVIETAGQAARPNILWISAEDLSPDLGSYGDPYAITPHLDRLSAAGVRYTHAFAAAPVCAPSRSGIITGMYPVSIGSHHMRSKAVPPAGVRAFTEYLRAAGYYCTNNSKTDYNFEAPPSHRPPLTLWDESSPRAHWRGRSPGQPFFAVFNIMATHESQIRVDDEAFARQTRALRPADRHDPARATLPPYYPDTPLVRRDWARYYDLVTAMDHQVGEILRQLEEDGLAGETIVFFWGDHGRGLPRAKRWTYDSGLRVPLIVRWPGRIPAGTSRADLVNLIDLGPTALSIAGVPLPAQMQGRPFLGRDGAAAQRAAYVFSHRDRMDEAEDMVRTARDDRYRYIRNFRPSRPYAQYIDYLEQMPTMRELRRLYKDHFNALSPDYGRALTPAQLKFMAPEKPAEELYDLASDPFELENLAAQPAHAATLGRMRAALEAWMKETGDLGLVPEAELRERMRPGGKWIAVAAPVVARAGGGSRGEVRVNLSCPTEGASIVYTTEAGEGARWKLYTGELRLREGAQLRARAGRLGYLDSPETSSSF
jgi:uncharacterized sulfatase